MGRKKHFIKPDAKSSLSRFKSKYSHLKKKGLKINGVGDLIGGHLVIGISHPFLFDNRLIPNQFEGYTVRKSTMQDDLPEEFKQSEQSKNKGETEIEWRKNNYIWAPERFEKFVDRCPDRIRAILDNSTMSREEMLDALCFGNFKAHKAFCEEKIRNGLLPQYKED